MSANGEARSCLFNDNLPSPFKAGDPSPLRSIPGGHDASSIKPDLLHNFNLGMGGDLWVSTLWGLCRMKVFEGRSIQARLDSAFERFEAWCSWNRKTPHIKCFDAIKFKMTSTLFCIFTNIFLGLGIFFWSCSPIHYPALQNDQCQWFQGRRTFLRRWGELMTRLCCANGWQASWIWWSLVMWILSIN